MSEPELIAKVDSVSRERAALELELAPRRKEEATILARLRARQATLLSLIAHRRKAITYDEAMSGVLERRKAQLLEGLNRRGRLWARIGEPLFMALALLFALGALGLGRSFRQSLAVLVFSLFAGTLGRRMWRALSGAVRARWEAARG